MNCSNHFVAISYNFNADQEFVSWLSDRLAEAGVRVWYLRSFDRANIADFVDESERDIRYPEDWRLKKQNWQATFLHELQRAAGVAVVVSQDAVESIHTTGRGMWRESEAIDFLQSKDPSRVCVVSQPRSKQMLDGQALKGFLSWAAKMQASGPLPRQSVPWTKQEKFNKKTGKRGEFMAPEMKTLSTVWFELVRLDQYDVMWFCRRCSIESSNYILGTEVPPDRCPKCGFAGYEPDYDFTGLSRPLNYEPNIPEGEKKYFDWQLNRVIRPSIEIVKLLREALDAQSVGNHNLAMDINCRVERLSRSLFFLDPLASAYFEQADLVRRKGSNEHSAELFGHAERILREIGDRKRLSYCLYEIGKILLARNRVVTALSRFSEAANLACLVRNRTLWVKTLRKQAECHVLLDHLESVFEK